MSTKVKTQTSTKLGVALALFFVGSGLALAAGAFRYTRSVSVPLFCKKIQVYVPPESSSNKKNPIGYLDRLNWTDSGLVGSGIIIENVPTTRGNEFIKKPEMVPGRQWRLPQPVPTPDRGYGYAGGRATSGDSQNTIKNEGGGTRLPGGGSVPNIPNPGSGGSGEGSGGRTPGTGGQTDGGGGNKVNPWSLFQCPDGYEIDYGKLHDDCVAAKKHILAGTLKEQDVQPKELLIWCKQAGWWSLNVPKETCIDYFKKVEKFWCTYDGGEKGVPEEVFAGLNAEVATLLGPYQGAYGTNEAAQFCYHLYDKDYKAAYGSCGNKK